MRVIRDIMGMPVVVELVDGSDADIEQAFERFKEIDARFSTYKHESEISRINRGDLSLESASAEMLSVLALAERERVRTGGVFDIRTPDGTLDPSGLVKGWAIREVARLVERLGHHDYWIEAGGDIQINGHDEDGREWRVGIRHPSEHDAIVQAIAPGPSGIATSGTYLRGQHIYDPRTGRAVDSPYLSLTVVGPDVYEADLWATTAFVMGEAGVEFMASMPGFEAYAIDRAGIATMTPGWQSWVR